MYGLRCGAAEGVVITHNELQIILEAREAGTETVTLPVINGRQWLAEFCGTCGRMICHPDCPRRKAAA